MKEYFSQGGGVNIQVSRKDSSSRTLWWGKMRYWIFCLTAEGGVLQTWTVPHACSQIFVFKAYTKLDSLIDWKEDWESVRKTYVINFEFIVIISL